VIAFRDQFGDGKQGASRRIGYIGYNETPAPVWRDIENGLPDVEWVDFAPEIDKRRVEKTDLQLTFHRRAAEICDAIFQTVQRDVRKGLKTYQLQAAMEHTARFEGCEYSQTWLTVAPRADYDRFFIEECERVPQEGDQVIPGIYLTYDGHWGHAIRTGTVGQPTAPRKMASWCLILANRRTPFGAHYISVICAAPCRSSARAGSRPARSARARR